MAETTFSMFTPPSQRALQGTMSFPMSAKPPVSLAEKHRPTSLDEVVGQGPTVWRIRQFLEAPYSSAFLFTGPTGVGKTTIARIVAAELGGLEVIKSGMQDADAVGAALRSLHFTPMIGSGWKVVIVDEADYMSPKAAQMWLSALEDLPTRSVIIFTTNNPDKFTDRFIDRCERFDFEGAANIHMQDAQALADSIWLREVGNHPFPALKALSGVTDRDGNLSYRRVVRVMEAAIAEFRASSSDRQQVPPAVRPTSAEIISIPPDLATRRRAAALKAVATRRARQAQAQGA